MKKIIYLLMSLSFVAFVSCSDDKEKTSSKGGSSVYKSGTQDGHDYVDLGLPSGTKWATCNVGATKPEEVGNFYAWGEVEPKDNYDWSTYKHSITHGIYKYEASVTKYKIGYNEDNKRVLDLEDDAAYVNWGGKWRMPTKTQLEELVSQCYTVVDWNYKGTKILGCIFYKAKSPEDKGVMARYSSEVSSSYSYADAHIFLPHPRRNNNKASGDVERCYWSSSLEEDYSKNYTCAWALLVEDSRCVLYRSRASGCPIRPVFK
ncbi:MAG: hypothetical protein IJP79_09845 [Paludibacteraceae bacterium]|nr:hypothetical protein [Paludibacteraceae bacterium]